MSYLLTIPISDFAGFINPKWRLVNPAKLEIGIIGKHYIDQINKSIREKLNVNHWRNTQAVTIWSNDIRSKSNSFFIKFNIGDLYPSISKDLLLKAIDFAKSVIHIQDKFIETIQYSCKALLFNKSGVWVKKDNPDLNVTMGSYDETEVCELVGLYILDIFTKEFSDNKIGLYRDDGFSCFQNLSGPKPEKQRKIYSKSTVECNLQITDYLDVTFD